MALYHRVAPKPNFSSRRVRDLRRNFASYNKTNPYVLISEEIREALDGARSGSPPVVALESAIYTHGT